MLRTRERREIEEEDRDNTELKELMSALEMEWKGGGGGRGSLLESVTASEGTRDDGLDLEEDDKKEVNACLSLRIPDTILASG